LPKVPALVLREISGIEILRKRRIVEMRTDDIRTIEPDAGQEIVAAGG
jgi:hypothetical protein